jgi:hypothetical protein
MLVRLVRLPTLPAGVHRSQTVAVVRSGGGPLKDVCCASSDHAVSTNELRR